MRPSKWDFNKLRTGKAAHKPLEHLCHAQESHLHHHSSSSSFCSEHFEWSSCENHKYTDVSPENQKWWKSNQKTILLNSIQQQLLRYQCQVHPSRPAWPTDIKEFLILNPSPDITLFIRDTLQGLPYKSKENKQLKIQLDLNLCR